MDFEWDSEKSDKIKNERGFGLEEAATIFAGNVLVARDNCLIYGEDRYRAIGYCQGICYTVIFTDRFDETGKIVRRLITAWKANQKERRLWQSFVKT